ncbi:nucleotide sugar dehydrogenase [Rhodococcus rhodochrous]|uniref:nucleotide sugar dehydrogenase n=1 Tax=Rhodococcus rhodochrous TaxID=1829 RepID=UPI001326FAF7|nr:nucleotide sugar dehydrogenase [Rhodococcus rhodochrous]
MSFEASVNGTHPSVGELTPRGGIEISLDPSGSGNAHSDAGHSEVDQEVFDVAIVGLGYVGLPTALSFHDAGYRVLGLDVNSNRLDTIRRRHVDLIETDRQRLERAVEDSRFMLTADPAMLRRSTAVVICVPTPVDEHLVPDLGPLMKACNSVVEHTVPGQLVMLTSTTYVGCTEELLAAPLRSRGLIPGTDVFVAFSPERINPGTDAYAHENVPRVVGGVTPACTEAARALVAKCVNKVHPVSRAEVAEMSKLLENTFRAVNIALVNEFADICCHLEIDVTEVIEAAATKPYGFMPFFPGAGVGGHCIPCDPQYLLWQLRKQRRTAPLIELSMNEIALRPRHVVERVIRALSDRGRRIRGARVLLVGVAYKPDVEDLRESPALEIMEDLRREGSVVSYYDPLIPVVRLRDGTEVESVTDPSAVQPDLVVVHTLHTGEDTNWLADQPQVLDATYRLKNLSHVLHL